MNCLELNRIEVDSHLNNSIELTQRQQFGSTLIREHLLIIIIGLITN